MCHVCLQLQHSGFQYVASDVRDGHLSLLDDLLHLLLRLRLTLEDKVELASIVIFNLMSITISLSDILQCGLLISEELVGDRRDLLTSYFVLQ